MAMHEGDGMHTSPPTANGWPWQMSCLVDRAWGKARNNNTVYTGVCVCGKQMGAKVNLTRILHHYRFSDSVKRPDISKCAFSRDQLERDYPEFIKLRDEHFAKKAKCPAANQAAPAPTRAVEMVAAAAAAAARARGHPLPWVGFPYLGPKSSGRWTVTGPSTEPTPQ